MSSGRLQEVKNNETYNAVTLKSQLTRTSRNKLCDWTMHPFGLRGLQPYDWLMLSMVNINLCNHAKFCTSFPLKVVLGRLHYYI